MLGEGENTYMDEQDIQDLVLGVWRPVTPSIPKPEPDHLPSRLLVQEPLVLFILCILCILCIDVHNGKISILGAGPASLHRTSLRLAGGISLRPEFSMAQAVRLSL